MILAGTGAQLSGGVGVEIAIAAAGAAKRHVYVNAERGIAESLGRITWQGTVFGNRFTLWQRSWHRAEDKL